MYRRLSSEYCRRNDTLFSLMSSLMVNTFSYSLPSNSFSSMIAIFRFASSASSAFLASCFLAPKHTTAWASRTLARRRRFGSAAEPFRNRNRVGLMCVCSLSSSTKSLLVDSSGWMMTTFRGRMSNIRVMNMRTDCSVFADLGNVRTMWSLLRSFLYFEGNFPGIMNCDLLNTTSELLH